MLVPDDDQGEAVTLRHLKSRHGECRDIALTFHRKQQRFTPFGTDQGPRPDAGKLKSALAAMWARTAPAADDDEGGEDD
jgi:replicative DNA helicase